ncbi:MAG: cytochrome c biogenesis protein ResB, partial [Actinobacteria bacterium]
LALCTLACAVERPRVAVRTLRAGGAAPPALLSSPHVASAPVAAGSTEAALDAASRELRAARLRVRRTVDGLAASANAWGALGSPVFHWALVLLFVAVAGGRLTRAEGAIDLPLGRFVTDESSSYLPGAVEGPLYRGHSGLAFSASGFSGETVVDGLDRGPSAVVGVYRGGELLAEQRVYPNSPLRYRGLLVHRASDWGWAPKLAVETTSGEVLASVSALIDSTLEESAAVGPGEVEFTAPGRAPAVIAVRIPYASREGSRGVLARAVTLTVQRAGEASRAPVTIAEGEAAPLFDGLHLRFAERGSWIRITVADDRSIPFIYGLFGLACVGLLTAVLFPPRRAWVAAISDGDAMVRLHAVVRHARSDPGFRDRVAGAIEAAAAAYATPDPGSEG